MKHINTRMVHCTPTIHMYNLSSTLLQTQH